MEQTNEVVNAVKSAVTNSIEPLNLELQAVKSELDVMKTNYTNLESRITENVKNSRLEVKEFDMKGNEAGIREGLSKFILQGLKSYKDYNPATFIKSFEDKKADSYSNRFAYEFAQKNLSQTSYSGGGLFIQPQIYQEVLPYLFVKGLNDVIRRKGNVVDMKRGTLNIVVDTYVGEDASFVAPNTAGQLAEMAGWTNLVLAEKILKTNIVFDNNLIDNADINTVQYIERKTTTKYNLFKDNVILYGQGVSNGIKGLTNQYSSANDFAIGGTTLSLVRADLVKAKSRIDTALSQNMDLSRCAFVMNSRVKYYIETLATVDGYVSELAQEIMRSGTLAGVEVVVTNLIPTNLSGSNTEILFIDFSDIFYGISEPMSMEFARNDAYTNNSGSVIYGKDTEQSILRISEKFDLLMARPTAMLKITGVTY